MSTSLATSASSARSLLRRLRWYDGFILCLTVPAGAMASLGYTIASIGALAAAALWAASAAIGLTQDYIFAEMAAMYPAKPGGIALFANESWKKYSRPFGAVAAWGYWMGWSLGLAVFGLLIGQLVQSQWFPNSTWTFFDGAVHVGLPHLIAAGAVIAVWLLNIFGIRPAVWVNYVIGVLLMLIFVVFIVGPIVTGNFHPSFLTWQLGGSGQGWGGWKLALVWLFVMGWSTYATELAATFAPEYKDVRRDTFRGMRSSGIFALIIFALLPIGTAGTVGEAAVTANPVGYYVPVFSKLIGNAGGFVILVLCAALFLSMNSNTAGASRALFGMAKDGLTVRQLGHLNRHHIPGRAATVDLAANLILVFFVGSTLGVLFASNVGYFVCIVFALSGFLLLRRDQPNATRPIKLRAAWVPVAVILTGFNLVLLLVGITNPGLAGYGGLSDSLIGLGLLLIAVPLWALRVFVQDRSRRPTKATPASSDEDIEYAAEHLPQTRFGD
jgi:amino acid transporter